MTYGKRTVIYKRGKDTLETRDRGCQTSAALNYAAQGKGRQQQDGKLKDTEEKTAFK